MSSGHKGEAEQVVRVVYAAQAGLLSPALVQELKWSTFAATVAILLWIVQYTLSAPWWRDQVGWTIVLKDVFLLAILVPSCIAILWPSVVSVKDLAYIEAVMLPAITLAMIIRMAIWFRIRKPWPLRTPEKSVQDAPVT